MLRVYIPRFSWYSRFREWLTIPNTTAGTIVSRLLIYRMENRRSWRLLNLSIIRTRPLIRLGADRKTGPLVEGPAAYRGAGRYEWPNRPQSAVRSRDGETRPGSSWAVAKRAPSLPDVFAKRGRSNPRDRDSINIRRRGPLDLIIRFDQCR